MPKGSSETGEARRLVAVAVVVHVACGLRLFTDLHAVLRRG